MGGLVLDIVLAYLFKTAVRTIHFVRSYKWERTVASFTDWVVEAPSFGCSSVRLNYKFVWDGVPSEGCDEIPFYMRWHSKTYAQSLSRELRPVIRVNRLNPTQTHFFEADQ